MYADNSVEAVIEPRLVANASIHSVARAQPNVIRTPKLKEPFVR